VGALCANISKEEIAKIKSTWLHNLMDLELTKETKDQLRKRLAFTPTPRDPPITGILIATEQAATLLGTDTASTTHLRNGIKNYKPRQTNTTKEEREAMQNLQKNKDVTILPADKGQATVLMPRSDYEEKMTGILDDGATYKKLPGDPTSKHKKKLENYLLHKVKTWDTWGTISTTRLDLQPIWHCA
jgi:hypothetical protein